MHNFGKKKQCICTFDREKIRKDRKNIVHLLYSLNPNRHAPSYIPTKNHANTHKAKSMFYAFWYYGTGHMSFLSLIKI